LLNKKVMKKFYLLILLIFNYSIIIAQNDNNTKNRSKVTVKDSLMTNTYNLETNQKQDTYSESDPTSGYLEPVSKTNLFQDPNDPSTTWKDYARDGDGNIIYDKGDGNNGSVRWQDASYWSSREKQGMWEVVKLPYVSEDDVIWGTRVTRDIYIDEPSNIPLKYPHSIEYDDHMEDGSGGLTSLTNNQVFSGIDARKNLFQILFDAAWAGQINVYNSKMSRQYSEAELKGGGDKAGVLRYLREEAELVDYDDVSDDEYIEEGEEAEAILVLTPFPAYELKKYRIVEDWFFDKRRSKMDVRIISITPYVKIDGVEVEEDFQDEFEEGQGDQDLATVGTYFYPEIRQLLANHKIYNEQNMMHRMCFDEYFQRRLFNSTIIKESNVYDRGVGDYIESKNKLAQLLEAERIKENIRRYEHNAWEY